MKRIVGVGFYLKDDYEEILRISTDREEMDEMWEDWQRRQKRVKKQFKSNGFKVIDILVKPEAIVEYCNKRGMEINGKSRSHYISYRTSKVVRK